MSSSHPSSSVPVFILAGGYGTRISEESQFKPKPMIEIGNLPILIHIMRSYYAFGFNDFVICAGYRAIEIKKFFMSYQFHTSDLEIDHRQSTGAVHRPLSGSFADEKWRVRVLDTGLNTQTGGRVARAFDRIQELSPFQEFALTYGDGLCDVNLARELEFHREHGSVGTVLGVKNMARYGELDVAEGNRVAGFLEKPASRQGYISGGFFFFNARFREFLSTEESCIMEATPLTRLAAEGQLQVFKHAGFWQPMDTLRDKIQLQKLWDAGQAPWKPGHTGGAEILRLEPTEKTDRRARPRKTG